MVKGNKITLEKLNLIYIEDEFVEDIAKTISLYFVTLIPVAFAAISLSLIAVMALPCLERIMF